MPMLALPELVIDVIRTGEGVGSGGTLVSVTVQMGLCCSGVR
jgi:hypothetical protein